MEIYFSITMSFFLVVYAIYAVSSIKEYAEIRKLIKEMKNQYKNEKSNEKS